MAQRPPLSLTAELERLEQQITLTYQEIDHNFARAHRIVTSSILPIVERYAKESEAVWDGSKFWKQFFEASANVSLSNYQEEEPAYEDDEHTHTAVDETVQHTYRDESTYPASSPGNYAERTAELTAPGGDETAPTLHDGDDDDSLLDDSLLESLNLTGAASQSTPKGKQKAPARTQQPAPGAGGARATSRWADIDSPYDALKREFAGKYGEEEDDDTPDAPQLTTNLDATTEDSSIPPPSTPRRPGVTDDIEIPESSPFHGPARHMRTPGTAAGANDQILHRVLDKNWRIQATPLGKPAPTRYRTAATPKAQLFSRNVDLDLDSSPMSPQEPQLHTTFFSPAKGGGVKTPRTAVRGRTPARQIVEEDEVYSDDDSDLLMPPGFSPPKTIQFSLPPSKLLATPAREASRRIVHDILQTAGASVDESQTTADSSPLGRGLEDVDPF